MTEDRTPTPTMTVSELITRLGELPSDALVYMRVSEKGYPIASVDPKHGYLTQTAPIQQVTSQVLPVKDEKTGEVLGERTFVDLLCRRSDVFFNRVKNEEKSNAE